MQDLIPIAGAAGLGAIAKSLVDWTLNRRRNDTDITRMAVEITASVMAELRTELEDTRAELSATRRELAATRAQLGDAHREVEDLRSALADAREELDIYRKDNT